MNGTQSLEAQYPVGTIVRQSNHGDATFRVVGYWRGYVTVASTDHGTLYPVTHQAPASELAVVNPFEVVGELVYDAGTDSLTTADDVDAAVALTREVGAKAAELIDLLDRSYDLYANGSDDVQDAMSDASVERGGETAQLQRLVETLKSRHII